MLHGRGMDAPGAVAGKAAQPLPGRRMDGRAAAPKLG